MYADRGWLQAVSPDDLISGSALRALRHFCLQILVCAPFGVVVGSADGFVGADPYEVFCLLFQLDDLFGYRAVAFDSDCLFARGEFGVGGKLDLVTGNLGR